MVATQTTDWLLIQGRLKSLLGLVVKTAQYALLEQDKAYMREILNLLNYHPMFPYCPETTVIRQYNSYFDGCCV
jgi:hypothetical protein